MSLRVVYPCLVTVLLWSVSTTLPADERRSGDGGSNHALNGLRAVSVSVSDVDPRHRRFGLIPEGIKAMVEERLRSAGIEIVSESRALADEHAAMLDVSCRVVEGVAKYNSYAVGLKLKQKIPLPNSRTAFTTSTIWSDGQVGAIRQIEVNRLNGYIAEVLERFVADYRSQNG